MLTGRSNLNHRYMVRVGKVSLLMLALQRRAQGTADWILEIVRSSPRESENVNETFTADATARPLLHISFSSFTAPARE